MSSNYSLLLLLCLVFLLAPSACCLGFGFARDNIKHIMRIIDSSSAVQFSGLAWDPVAGNFVAGSISGPNVYAIIPEVEAEAEVEAGTLKCLVDSEPNSNSTNSSSGAAVVAAVTVDYIRQRLIVVFSNNNDNNTNQSSIAAAYDMQYSSYPYGLLFTVALPQLDSAASGVAVDLGSGDVFVSSATRGVVLKVGFQGEVLEQFQVYNNSISDDVEDLVGLCIPLMVITSLLSRVDSESGQVTEISYRGRSDWDDPTSMSLVHAISIILQSNTSTVLATNEKVVSIYNDHDTSWQKTAAYGGTVELGGHGNEAAVVALAARDDDGKGKTYALMVNSQGYFIGEIYWGYKGKWNYAIYALLAFWILLAGAFMSHDMWRSCTQTQQ